MTEAKKQLPATLPEFQCTALTAVGERCKQPKLKGGQVCRFHQSKPEVALLQRFSIKNTNDLREALVDTASRVQSGELTHQQGSTIASLFAQTQNIFKHQLENDPNNIATRVFSAQAAWNIANNMTLAEAREIAANRNPELLARVIANPDYNKEKHEEELHLLEVVEESMEELNKVIKTKKTNSKPIKEAQSLLRTETDSDPEADEYSIAVRGWIS
jgi:hypothetical protein